jgi:VCBS repeat-containing protein
MDAKDQAVFREFPPLQTPFGGYQVSPLAEVLFYQKIGNVTTRTPMILFTNDPARKVGIIAGENIWRWRISDYVQQSNHESFDLWIDKIAQYLSTREDKSFFRIRVNGSIFENEPVEMEAELYNASYELINQPDVNITITDSDGKNYPFVFSRTEKAYVLNAGIFPVGEYTYRASAKAGSSQYQKTGKLFIEKVNVENANLVADHNLLFRIAAAHDGEMVSRENMAKLADKILARQDIRSVAVYQKRMSDLVGNPWLFALIIALLTAEWVIRKREGL